MSSEHPIPTMPTPEVDNLRTATHAQLADEVITLRLYVSNLVLALKDLRQAIDEATGQAPQRLLELEERQTKLGMRVFELEGKEHSRLHE